MAGQGCARRAVHQEADLGDTRQVGMQSAANGEYRQRLGLKARRVVSGKSASEVDDGEFGASLL